MKKKDKLLTDARTGVAGDIGKKKTSGVGGVSSADYLSAVGVSPGTGVVPSASGGGTTAFPIVNKGGQVTATPTAFSAVAEGNKIIADTAIPDGALSYEQYIKTVGADDSAALDRAAYMRAAGLDDSGDMSYSDYMAAAGIASPSDAYGKSVAAANKEFDRSVASYGRNAEALGRTGLTGSGYSDYITGAAYAARQGAVAGAVAQQNADEGASRQSYADYILGRADSRRANDAAYEGYKSDVSAQGRLNAAGYLQYLEQFKGDKATAEGVSAADSVAVYSALHEQAAQNGLDEATLTYMAIGLGLDEETAKVVAHQAAVTGGVARDKSVTATADGEAVAWNQSVAALDESGGATSASAVMSALLASGASEEQATAALETYKQSNSIRDADRFRAASTVTDAAGAAELNKKYEAGLLSKEGYEAALDSVQARTSELYESAMSDVDGAFALFGYDADAWAELTDERKDNVIYENIERSFESGNISEKQRSQLYATAHNNTLEAVVEGGKKVARGIVNAMQAATNDVKQGKMSQADYDKVFEGAADKIWNYDNLEIKKNFGGVTTLYVGGDALSLGSPSSDVLKTLGEGNRGDIKKIDGEYYIYGGYDDNINSHMQGKAKWFRVLPPSKSVAGYEVSKTVYDMLGSLCPSGVGSVSGAPVNAVSAAAGAVGGAASGSAASGSGSAGSAASSGKKIEPLAYASAAREKRL